MKNFKPILYPVILICISIIIALLIAEISIRAFVPSYLWKFRGVTSDWKPDSLLGWVQKPNLNIYNKNPNGLNFYYQTNKDGLIPPTARRNKNSNVIRIMIFGDSTVVGRSVPPDKTVNSYLERYLIKNGLSVEVINAGVQGYSTDQSLILMEKLIPIYQPDFILHAVCTNDFGGNNSNGAYGRYKPRFIINDKDVLKLIKPKENKQIAHYGSGLKHWIQFSAVYRIFQPFILKLRAKFGSWDEKNLLGLANEIYFEPKSLDNIDWKLFRSLIIHMNKVAEENGAQFFLYSHPAIEEIWDPFIMETLKRMHLSESQYDRYAIEKRISKISKEEYITFIPLIDYFLRNKNLGPFHLLPRNPHCNPVCYKLTAQKLGEQILSYNFTSQEVGEISPTINN